MSNLTLRNVQYNFIPEVAEKDFINKIWYWYEAFNDYPIVNTDMIYGGDDDGRLFLMEIFRDVTDYLYTKDLNLPNNIFNPNQFPIDKDIWESDHWKDSEEVFSRKCDKLELAFYIDMKQYLNANYVFYAESYFDSTWGKVPNATAYRNHPLVEVW